MIIIDIESNKVVIAFVTMSGPDMSNMAVVTKWELVESYKYHDSGEVVILNNIH